MAQKIHAIAIFPKIQPDTVAAVFLLQQYGRSAFPGIEGAEIVFWSSTPPGKSAEQFEEEGVLLIDLAGSRFDHHRDDHGRKTECASSLVAKYLGIEKRPELRKLLTYCRRDDLEGKGTVSSDPLDRAFGLSGVITTLNRVHGGDPKAIFDIVRAVFEAHVHEEWKRTEQMPAEWKKLKADGLASEFFVRQAGRSLRCIALESENVSMPGFLRAYLRADLVVQRMASGHTNLITRQQTRLDLRELVAGIRREEAKMKGVELGHLEPHLHRKPGRLDEIEEWFYDTAANTVQNGGVNPQDIPPTRITLGRMVELIEECLAEKEPAR